MADAVWTPERTLDEAGAARLISEAFPELSPVKAALMGAGWDNTAFLVDDALVFRFPRRAVAVPLLEIENAVLPQIAPRLPLAIPAPIFYANQGEGFPWPFAGYPLVPGRTLETFALSKTKRCKLAAPLGAFLKALHAIPTDDLPLPGDAIGRLELTRRLPGCRERLIQASALGLIPDLAPLAALLDASPPDSHREDTLVHGDLYARHLVLDSGGALTGAIDWGDVHRGDPACDLMAAHLLLPPAAHPEFLRAYGPVSGETWHAARVRAAGHSLAVILYAAEIHDAPLLAETQVALDFLSSL